MATLAVRPVRIRDLPLLGSIRDTVENLGSSTLRFREAGGRKSRLLAARPGFRNNQLVLVATIDNEVCAWLSVVRDDRDLHWDLAEIAAGSPRLVASPAVCLELWSALIRHAVQEAGANGVKRVYAVADDDSVAMDALRENGFESFEQRFILKRQGRWPEETTRLVHVRPQQDSDIWSIHQLYHQVTPRGVQFAEARTSAEWEPRSTSWFNRTMIGSVRESSFVLDGGDGVLGHCRIISRGDQSLARMILAPQYANQADSFLFSSIVLTGSDPSCPFYVDVPGYLLEYLGVLERCGFEVVSDRIGLVKHTTSPVVVRPKLTPVPAADERERIVHGVPSV